MLAKKQLKNRFNDNNIVIQFILNLHEKKYILKEKVIFYEKNQKL